MIGIVLPSVTLNHELKHLYEKDSLFNQYKPLAKKYKVDFCMFSFRQIPQNLKAVEAIVYSYPQDRVIQKLVTVPRVNIVRNTSYVLDQGLIAKFEIFCNQNVHFINFPLYWQANKLQNYEYLSSVDQLKSHVPPTKRLTYEYLQSFIQLYDKVIVKPIYGSKGRGMTIIEKAQDQYQVYQTSSRKYVYNNRGLNLDQKTISVSHSQIKQFFNETFSRPASFLVQQWIPFKKFNDCPFDIRAVVQKNGNNRWQVTSRVARVANQKAQITNLHQGGEMVSLSQLKLKKFQPHIRQFSLEIAKAFEKLYPWSADMGIDLAIDIKGKLWYIETNFCSEKERWLTIFKIPFEYAYYIYTR